MDNLKHVLLIAFITACSSTAFAQWHLSVETGAAFNDYNEVQVPGTEAGTRFSLSDQLFQDNYLFIRARMGYLIKQHHDVCFTAAPVRINRSGRLTDPVSFGGKRFNTTDKTEGTYVFNTYRLTYRYVFYPHDRIEIGVGLTGLLRDAEISLQQRSKFANTTDLGFVPLISLYFGAALIEEKLELILDADALVGPQGRAEDAFLGLQYNPFKNIGLYTGYRIIDGGADVDQVYNFARLHFVSVGLNVHY